MQKQPLGLERLSHISMIATALIAIGALAIAIWQIQATADVEREASARAAFKDYLKMAIDKPELADARREAIEENDKVRSSYHWFVTYFLYSAEQIFDSYPDDPYWQAGLAEEICYHRIHLSSNAFQPSLHTQHGAAFAHFLSNTLQHCLTDDEQN